MRSKAAGVGRCGNHDRAGPLQHLFEAGFQQICDVRNRCQHEPLIAAVDLLQPDVGIVNADLAALADQMLEQRYDRALAQIVGVFLECQSKHADVFGRQIHHLLDGPLQMPAVAGQDGFMSNGYR